MTTASDTEVTGRPNTALLSLILMLGTFAIATALKELKTSHYLGKMVYHSCTFLSQFDSRKRKVAHFQFWH